MTIADHESATSTTGNTSSACSGPVGRGLLEELLVAWDQRLPGPQVAPGPADTGWRGPLIRPGFLRSAAPGVVPVGRLLRTAWHGPGPHALPDGRTSTVRRRPAPSAGGCYPVQLHVLVADGCDLPRGRYALDTATGWPRHIGQTEGPAGHALIVLTVLPARTAAKYHHRAWPLWVADTVYALRTIAALAATTGTTHTVLTGRDRVAKLRQAADLPDEDTWSARWTGTAPETVMSGLELSRQPLHRQQESGPRRLHPTSQAGYRSAWSSTISTQVLPDRSPAPSLVSRALLTPHDVAGGDLPADGADLDLPLGQLLRRRSPTPDGSRAATSATVDDQTLARFLRRLHDDAGTPPPGTVLDVSSGTEVHCAFERGALGNDQTWLAGVPVLLRIRHRLTPGPSAARDLIAAMWWAAWVGAAASLAGNARAVGGWTRPSGNPEVILHGVALWDIRRSGPRQDDDGEGTDL